MDDVVLKIEKANLGRVDKNVNLSKHTTYRVGGVAKAFVYPKNVSSLITLLKILNMNNIKYKILGNGSNLLFSDDDFDGIIIKLDEFNDVSFLSNNRIRVGAGFSLMKLSLVAAKKGLAGLEFAAGIPGTIGGAIFMNAGAYKSDMGYVVQQVKVLTPDFRVITLENREMDFHYRTSYLQKNPKYICLEVVLKLAKGEREVIEEVIKERRKRRM